MSDWEGVALGDLVEVHDSRRVPLSKITRAGRQGPYPYLGAQGVIDHIDDFIFDGEFLLVAEDGENLRSRKEPIARLVSGRFWVNNHAHILSSRSGLADDRFLLHLINHIPLDGRVTGSAQPKLTQTSLVELAVPCPSFVTQRRIAAVLSAFDELIEINERRIELLEDLARSLYREWFVHFRFPGREDVDLVDSELGPIPEGWDVVPASAVFKVNPRVRGAQPSYPKVTMADVDERFSHVLPSQEANRPSGSKFTRGDVLFARITPCLENGDLLLFPGVA